MGKKFTLDDCVNTAAEKGGKCLSTEYIGSKIKLLWECYNGHQWSATYNSIKRGSWCPGCAGNAKIRLEDAKKLAKLRGGECLSTEFVDIRTKLLWRCKKGHEWKVAYVFAKRGQWCPECARDKIRNTIQDAHDLAKSKGLKCLSTEYKNVQTPMLWECDNGHQWEATYIFVYTNKKCQECLGRVGHNIKEAQNMAKEKGGKCLSVEYVNIDSKMLWQCKKGHTWETSFYLIQKGYWCPECAGMAKKTLEDCVSFSEQMGGKCLSDEYKNINAPMLWECCEGHQWTASFRQARRNSWCPICKRTEQFKLFIILQKILPDAEIIYNMRKFEWLKNPDTSKKLEIDLWVPDNKLAIEYDGIQHFMPVRFNSISEEEALKKFELNKKLDKLKNKLIKKHPKEVKYFIRFKYDETIDRKHVIEKLKKYGVL